MGKHHIRTDSHFKGKLAETSEANGLKSVEQLCNKLISELPMQIVKKLKKMSLSKAEKYIDIMYSDYSSTTASTPLQETDLSIRLNAASDDYINKCMDEWNLGEKDRRKSDVIRILLAIGLLYLEDSIQVLKEFKISSINMQFPRVCYQHGNKENPNIKPEITKILQQISASIDTEESDITPINISPANVCRQDDNKEDSDIETETTAILQKLPDKIDTVVEPFMGMCGLTLNVIDTLSGRKLDYYANDADVNIINLYRCIQHKPNKMMLACERLIKKLKTGNDTFETIKARHLSEKKMSEYDYNTAADYMYLDAVSVRHKTDNLQKKSKKCISIDKQIGCFLEYAKHIRSMHQYLKRINISKKDALNVLKKFKKVLNVLFLLDPPYLDSCGYSKKTNNVEKFTDVAYESLIEFCLNVPDDSIFLLFCRFTQTRSGKRGETDEDIRAKEMNGDFKIGDKKLEGYYRRRFGVKAQIAGKQFYCKEIPFDGKGTIEAIISNYQFDGFIPF